jgi:hypothetical protein
MKSFKQYLLEYDANARKPMPGYTYDGQEPELRSDEDAEKTKEWVSNNSKKYDTETDVKFKNRQGDTVVKTSEVDLDGRPTGVIRQEFVDDETGFPKRMFRDGGFPERVWDPGGLA